MTAMHVVTCSHIRITQMTTENCICVVLKSAYVKRKMATVQIKVADNFVQPVIGALKSDLEDVFANS